jgi:hypothetical protein
MRRQRTLIVRTIAATIVATLSVAACVTASKLPPFPRRSPDQYDHVLREGNVVLVAEAVTDPHTQKKHFDVDLESKDILPVYVTVTNASMGDSLLVDPAKIRLLGVPKDNAPHLGNRSVESSLINVGTATLVVSPVVAMPILIVGSAMMGNRINAQHHLESQALRAETLSPGQTVQGFVYFSTADAGARQSAGIRVPLQNLTSERDTDYAVPFSSATR